MSLPKNNSKRGGGHLRWIMRIVMYLSIHFSGYIFQRQISIEANNFEWNERINGGLQVRVILYRPAPTAIHPLPG